MNKGLSKENKIFNKNNLTNWIIGGIIALIIGKIMEPLFVHIFSLVLNISGSFITNIENSTYKEISNGYSEQSASSVLYLVYLSIYCLIGVTFVDNIIDYLAFKNKQKKFKAQDTMSTTTNTTLSELSIQNIDKERKKINFSYLLGIIFSAIILISLIFFYGKSSFIRNKTITLTNNIEIVSPYISDIEYKQMKSKFHSIETKNDYILLIEELETIAKKYSLKLK